MLSILSFCFTCGSLRFVRNLGWQGWSCQCFKQCRPILRQGIPSCVSVCLEWWWYELLVLLSGLLTNAADAVATAGIIILVTLPIYNFHFALSLAVSTKVGNNLGANRPNKAKTSSFVIIHCTTLCFLNRNCGYS